MFTVQPRRSNATNVERESAEPVTEETAARLSGSSPVADTERKKKRRRH
jgi:hypothetical protein